MIDEAVEEAQAALRGFAKREFENLVEERRNSRRRPWLRRKGRLGWTKIENFLQKISHGLRSTHHVYVFWNGDTCTYVGQTVGGGFGGGGKWRPEVWRNSTHFQIFTTAQKRNLNKLECLAIDRLGYWPEYNNYKIPMEYYMSKCPVHGILEQLKLELRTIFAFKR